MFTDFDDYDYVDEKVYRDPASGKSKDKRKVVDSYKRRTGEYQGVQVDDNGFPIKTATVVAGTQQIEVSKSTHRRPQRNLNELRRADKGTHRQLSKDNRRVYEEAFENEEEHD